MDAIRSGVRSMKKNLAIRAGAIAMVLLVAFFSILPDLVSAEGDDTEPSTQIVAEEEMAEIPDVDAADVPEETPSDEDTSEDATEPEGDVTDAPETDVPETDIPETDAPEEDLPSENLPEEGALPEEEEPDVDSEKDPAQENPSEDTTEDEKTPSTEAPAQPEAPSEPVQTAPGEPNVTTTTTPPANVDPNAGAMDTTQDYLNLISHADKTEMGESVLKTLDAESGVKEVENIVESDEKDFVMDGSTLVGYQGPGGYIQIPDGVTAIADQAFAGNATITGVVFPASLQSIGSGAFAGCSNLASLHIPDSVTSVGASAFANCTGLAEIGSLGAGSGSVAPGEFSNCVSLQSVTVPEGISSIASGAFAGCSNLGSVSLPGTLENLDRDAFSGDINLASISVASRSYSSYDGCVYSGDGSQLLICPQGKTGISIAPGTHSVASGAFSGCNYLLSAVIPNATGAIEANAFSGSAIRTVTIPSGVTSIGAQAGWTPNVVYGFKGSTAETWARQSNYVFESLDGSLGRGTGAVQEEHIEDADPTDGSDDEEENKPGSNPGKGGSSGTRTGTKTPAPTAAAPGTGSGTTAAISRNAANRVNATPKTGVEDYGMYFLFGAIFLTGIASYFYSRKLRLDARR